MSFWEVHGYMGGVAFIAFLMLFPRIAIFASVPVGAAGVYVAWNLGMHGLPGFIVAAITIFFVILAIMAVPRFVIALIGSFLYGTQNFWLCMCAWMFAYVALEALRVFVPQVLRHWRTYLEEGRRKNRARTRRQKIWDDHDALIRRHEEFLRRHRARRASTDEFEEALRQFAENIRRAEEARRSMPQRQQDEKPWWKVLGVAENASKDDISAAYRKIARESHPDSAPDRKGNADRFSEATRAYKEATRGR